MEPNVHLVSFIRDNVNLRLGTVSWDKFKSLDSFWLHIYQGKMNQEWSIPYHFILGQLIFTIGEAAWSTSDVSGKEEGGR